MLYQGCMEAMRLETTAIPGCKRYRRLSARRLEDNVERKDGKVGVLGQYRCDQLF